MREGGGSGIRCQLRVQSARNKRTDLSAESCLRQQESDNEGQEDDFFPVDHRREGEGKNVQRLLLHPMPASAAFTPPPPLPWPSSQCLVYDGL